MAILEAVVAGVILGGLGFAARWLRVGENRTATRQAICRHDWEPYPDYSDENFVFVTPYSERCRKCDKAR